MTPERIVEQIRAELVANTLQLPTLPEVALRLRNIAHEPDLRISEVARLIESDAALTAYLLHAVNTPIFRAAQPIDSVSRAINRLGLENTSNLAMTYAVRSLFRPRVKAIEHFFQRQWQLSAHLAALASALAQHCRGFAPGRALVAGLLQDIGALPLLQRLSRYPELVRDENSVLAIVERYAAEMGRELLCRWEFDDEFIEVARARKQWFRDPRPQPDYADLVLVARLHRYMGTPYAKSLPPLKRIPAFSKLAPYLGPKQSLQVLTEARVEVDSIRRLMAQ